jgi:polyphosphate glucokinase
MDVLGIDIGGSGIKGAMVDLETGELTSERYRIPTPKGGEPEAMADVVAQIIEHFNYKGKVGCGIPTIVKNGICKEHGNLSKKWKGLDAEKLLKDRTGLDFHIINDADAAASAIMHYGIGKGRKGFVLTITVGTGLGSGAYFNGQLIPNFELGQIPYKSYSKIELYAASSIKDKEDLSYKQWAKRFNKFLKYVNLIASPNLIIIGGGISKKWDKFEKYLDCDVEIIPAELQNHAGIIGAAAEVNN